MVATDGWPELYQLMLAGTGWIGASAAGLQAVVGIFLAGVLYITLAAQPVVPWFIAAPFFVAVAATLGSMYMAFRVKWAVQRHGGWKVFGQIAAEGDRRLARAVAEKTGRTVPLPPSVLAFAGATLLIAPQLYLVYARGIPLVEVGPAILAALPQAGVIFVALYLAMALPARWVGYQRIMANRFGAAIEARRPDKALPQ